VVCLVDQPLLASGGKCEMRNALLLCLSNLQNKHKRKGKERKAEAINFHLIQAFRLQREDIQHRQGVEKNVARLQARLQYLRNNNTSISPTYHSSYL